MTTIIEQRHTDEDDLSLNDICRHTGVQMTDFDMVFYSKKTWKVSLVVEKKHNALRGGYKNSTINFRENSIEIQRLFIPEDTPFGIAVTYTKKNEQKNQMVFFIPYNNLCWSKFKEFRGYKESARLKDFWMTPRTFAQFVWFCTYGKVLPPADIVKEWNSLEDNFTRYKLTKIICSLRRPENCSCQYCQLTDLNNKYLVKIENNVSKSR